MRVESRTCEEGLEILSGADAFSQELIGTTRISRGTKDGDAFILIQPQMGDAILVRKLSLDEMLNEINTQMNAAEAECERNALRVARRVLRTGKAERVQVIKGGKFDGRSG